MEHVFALKHWIHKFFTSLWEVGTFGCDFKRVKDPQFGNKVWEETIMMLKI